MRLPENARSLKSTFTSTILEKKQVSKNRKIALEMFFLHVLTTETKQRENYSPLHFCILNFGFTQNAP